MTGDHAELVVTTSRRRRPAHIYEVWLARGTDARLPTTALFSVTRSGCGDVDVPGSMRGVTGVMVTPEPAGGSQVPTHVPVIRASSPELRTARRG